MVRRSIRTGLLVLALAAGPALNACSSPDSGAAASSAPFTVRAATDPGNLNPLVAQEQSAYMIAPYLYDTLIGLSPDGEMVPQLAANWEAGPTSVTFTLKDGITCSDGTKLTASAVAGTFEWIKNPENASTVIGNQLPDPTFEVTADDDARTVTISRQSPMALLPQGAGTVPIVCPAGLQDPSTLQQGSAGTGPFTIASYAADSELVLRPRDGYTWGPNGASTDAEGFPSEVVVKFIKDESTAANLFGSGELDSVDLAGPDAGRIGGPGVWEMKVSSATASLYFNQRQGFPTKSEQVRQALVTAIDFTQLAKVATQGRGIVAPSLSTISPSPCTLQSTEGVYGEQDLTTAAAQLESAGWKGAAGQVRSKGGHQLTIRLLVGADDAATAAAMELLSKWWKQIGAQVTVDQQPPAAFGDSVFQGSSWDVVWLPIGISFPNTYVAFATGPASPDGQNFSPIDNAEYDRLVDRALSTPGEAGCELWGEAERSLFQANDVVPVATPQAIVFGRESVSYDISAAGIEPTSIRVGQT